MIGHVLTDGEDPRQTCPEDLRAASERAAPEIARASAMADRLTTIGAALGVAAVGGGGADRAGAGAAGETWAGRTTAGAWTTGAGAACR